MGNDVSEISLPGQWEKKDDKLFPADDVARSFYWRNRELSFLWQPEEGRRPLHIEGSRWHENRQRFANN